MSKSTHLFSLYIFIFYPLASMQLIGINNLIILNKLFAKLAQLIRINNFLEYSLIRLIRVFFSPLFSNSENLPQEFF